MRVYRVKTDSNNFNRLYPIERGDKAALRSDGSSRAQVWFPPTVVLAGKASVPLGDFVSPERCSLITSPRATAALLQVLEMAGELLPLPFEGAEYTFTNVTNVVDCYDEPNSEPVFNVYAIDPEPLRKTRSSLFKVLQTSHIEILSVTGLFAPEDDFMTIVEQQALAGLRPILLWSDEPDIQPWRIMHGPGRKSG